MPKKYGLFSDVFEQVGSTAKQTGSQIASMPKGIASTAVSQIFGKAKNNSIPKKNIDDKNLPRSDDGIEKISSALGKNQPSKSALNNPTSNAPFTEEQQLEVKKRQARIKAREAYKKIQEEIEKIIAEKRQKIPAYIAGQPGSPDTQQEKVDMIEKQRREAEEAGKKRKISLPGMRGGSKGVGERLKGVSG